ncbi:MAG: hypothetical protein ACOYJF_09815 [Prevotella sp.]|jgi:hypothetical protein
MKPIKNHNFLLAICVLVLVVLCWLSVEQPLRFEREQQRREQVVKHRLLQIRSAEEHYKAKHGTYSGQFASLVKSGLIADSLQYVPFSDGERFQLTASFVIGKTGRQIPVMECGATFQQYLKGLDRNSVANLIERANASGHFPGLKFGDVAEANGNATNWE